MASAWQQVEAIEKENQERRRRQLAATTRQATWVKHVRPIEDDGLLQVTGLSLAKVAVSVQDGQTSVQRTLAWQLSGSKAPGFQSATLRRVARPRGAINRRALTPAVVQNQTFARPMVSLTQTLPPVDRVVITGPPRIFVGTIVTIKGVSDAVLTPQIDPARSLAHQHQQRGASRRADDPRDARSGVSSHRRRGDARADADRGIPRRRHGALVETRSPRIHQPGVLPRSRSGDVRGRLQSAPGHAAGAERSRLPIEQQVLAHPQFPAPMSERLMELSPSSCFPGSSTSRPTA